jgi:nucleoside-diphosphate-sugar epimerase
MENSMGTALVTGATGFTGGALTRRLTEEGHQVTAFVRETSDVSELRNLDVEIVSLDITDEQQVRRTMRPFDRVFHIAASFRREHADLEEFRRVNVSATRNLLGAALDEGVGRFVHCSTVGIHGPIADPPAAESYRPKPNDHYQRSKLEGEMLAHAYFQKGLPGTVIRPTPIYGPGDGRFLKLFRAIKKGVFGMIGSGDTLYHMVYIDDLVQAFLLASEHDNALSEVFIVGGERHCTINDIVEEVARALQVRRPRLRIPLTPVRLAASACEAVCRPFGISPPLYRRRVEFFDMDRAFNIAKSRNLLGYRPKFDLTKGIHATARGYEAGGLL